MEQKTQRLAADIGGTFTDLAYLTDDGQLITTKVPSTPQMYADAVINGTSNFTNKSQELLDKPVDVFHGSTIATNAIIERKGARTALLTTMGFKDVLELRRIRVPTLYDPLYVKPPPLAPRRLRFEITERIDADGKIIKPLNPQEVERLIPQLRLLGVEAIAVCFLHSYTNSTHEKMVGKILRKEFPELFISLSVDILPQIREYERTSTTVINSYVGPLVKNYLNVMKVRLKTVVNLGRLMVMQSSGGVINSELASEIPAQIIECGPAAGVVGAMHVGIEAGYRNLITFDMGGTTAKASLIDNGSLTISDEYEVGGMMSSASSLVNGGGYALKLPVIDIAEVGAGGGSIVWLDSAGVTKIGPQSAGASPGPVCYGTGGEEPTVTDANVILGYQNPMNLAGGTVSIDKRLSIQALEQKVAKPLGRSVIETAYGIHMLANARMTRAVKAVTTYRGHDPRDFCLFAFGGNGGIHAANLARELRVNKVIVPPAAGVFSAIGLLKANTEVELTQSFKHSLVDLPASLTKAVFANLETQVMDRIKRNRTDVTFSRLVDIRYIGQAFELTIDLKQNAIAEMDVNELSFRFAKEHERRYGHAFSEEYPLEVVNLRVKGSLASVPATLTTPRTEFCDTERKVYFGPDSAEITTPVMSRGSLSKTLLQGPLIIEEYEGTTVVPPGCAAQLDDAGNIIIEVG